ncbi:MAG: ParB/RepB/Spo0J family partition protein [Verrucomicrobiota bacterium]
MDKRLALDEVDIYGGTQTRVATSDEAVEGYAEAMKSGEIFPPVIAFFDGSKYFLADGFHRYLAAKRIDEDEILAEVREGSRTDALIFALGANATNGVYRTNADKRRACEIALEEWYDRSNAYLADICKVSVELVRRVRKSMGLENPDMVVGKDGKSYPAKIARQTRGAGADAVDEIEKESGDSAGAGGSSKPGKKHANYTDTAGGTRNELETEAREMCRNLEMDPRELRTIPTALPTDYSAAAINLLEGMDREDSRYLVALDDLEKWISRQKVELAAPI